MRVLVYGGRKYRNYERLCLVLRNLFGNTMTVLIHGDAPGADRLAARWAKDNGIRLEPYPAIWRVNGVLDMKAGPKRNQRMLDESKPDFAVGFPGQTGTADMTRRLKAAGYNPILIT